MNNLYTSTMSLLSILFLAVLLTCVPDARSAVRISIFDVRKMGAVADGKTDNSAVFLRAWKYACERGGFSRVYIPLGTYKLFPVKFVGPCKGPVEIFLNGVIEASDSPNSLNFDHWITFSYVDGLTIRGGGTFDGQGASAWPYNKCAKIPNCKALPISLRFDFVNNTLIQSIKSINSKYFHINVFGSRDVKFIRVKIIAPADSPNTDGIHVGSSTGVRIYDSLITTGDDCISLGPGSKNIDISGISCGPGHGISIGSLGKYQNEEDVVGVTVRNSTLSWTENGVRIKTWESPFWSKAYNITFEDIVMNSVNNPIIIDQAYCPSGSCKSQEASRVQIEDTFFQYIRGTSTSEVAISLICSPLQPCKNVRMKDIDLRYNGPKGKSSRSLCKNVQKRPSAAATAAVIPVPNQGKRKIIVDEASYP